MLCFTKNIKQFNTPTGGLGAYTYLWSNGATTASISNLPQGNYWYKITDANGCYNTDTLNLPPAEAYSLNAGADLAICLGQTLPLKAVVSPATVATNILWTLPNGNTQNTDTLSITTPGIYTVSASTSAGCVKKDTVVVLPVMANVNTIFTVSSQTFAQNNITLVNISPTTMDNVQWILPPGFGVQLLSSSKNYCEFTVQDTGYYTVGMRAFYANGCIDTKYKTIHVIKKEAFVGYGNQADAFLKELTIYPNPTPGNFVLNMLFSQITPAKVRIISLLTNTSVLVDALSGLQSYSRSYNITTSPAGTYMVVVETPKGNFVYKLIKN